MRELSVSARTVFCAAAGAGLLLAGASGARATEPQTGIYIGLGAGTSYQSDSDVTGPGTNSQAEYNLGFGAAVSGGYAFSNGVRVEAEVSYRENDQDSLSSSGVITPGTRSDRTNTAILLNVIYDYHNDSGIIPSIGAGAGVAFTTAGQLGDRTKFAYQGIAGLGYQLTEDVTAFADYRFMGTPEIDGRFGGSTVSFDNYNHTLLFGVRIRLSDMGGGEGIKAVDAAGLEPVRTQVMQEQMQGRAAMSAAGAAGMQAEEVPTNYLVFFETNRVDLSAKAREVVRTAAVNLQRGDKARITVTGHADRAGSTLYNEQLARRRAEAVMRVLEASGVSSSEIALMSRGEEQPLVPTPDGQSEPQNRRVEIVLN